MCGGVTGLYVVAGLLRAVIGVRPRDQGRSQRHRHFGEIRTPLGELGDLWGEDAVPIPQHVGHHSGPFLPYATWVQMDGRTERHASAAALLEEAPTAGPPSPASPALAATKPVAAETSEDRRIGMIEGIILLAFLVFFVSIVQMLEYPDPQVRSYSYKTVFAIVSIFEALSFVTIQNEVIFEVAVDPFVGGKESGARHVISFASFLVWFVGSTWICWVIRHKPDALFAATGILSHVCAFVLVEAYATLQMNVATTIASEYGMPWVYTLYISAPFVVALFFFPLRFLMKRVRKAWRPNGPASQADPDPFLLPPIPTRKALAKSDAQAPAEGEETPVEGEAKDAHGIPFPPALPPLVGGAIAAAVAHRQNQVSAKRNVAANKSIQAWMKAAGVRTYDEAEAYEHWMHEVDEAENQTGASVQGFLICRACYCIAVARVPPVDCEADKLFGCNVQKYSFWVMVGCLVALYVAALWIPVLAGFCRRRRAEDPGAPPPVPSYHDEWNFAFVPNITLSLLMGMSWCVLVLVRWQLNEGIIGGTAGHRIVNAFAMSPCCVLIIIVMDKLADKRLIANDTAEALMKTFALCLGLEWEKAVQASIKATIAESAAKEFPILSQLFGCSVLAVVLLPAWMWFIVPDARLPVPPRLHD